MTRKVKAPIFIENDNEFIEERKILGYCETCGLEVLTNDDALTVIANGDIIHSACWDFYAAEHTELFTKSADTERRD